VGTDGVILPDRIEKSSTFNRLSEGVAALALILSAGADHIYEVLTNNQTDADHVIAITAEWFAKTL
jgi:hypothetical protein